MYVLPEQLHFVISGGGFFLLVRKRGKVFRVAPLYIAGKGHHQDITVIGNARSAEVGMRKTVHERIGIMITPAAVPTLKSGIGAELHHAEGHARAGVGMPVAARADKGIDQGGVVGLAADPSEV